MLAAFLFALMETATLDAPETNAIARYRQLDAEQFEIQHDVPVFAEHTADDGTIYDKETLEAIAENQNKRIRDTGDYTAICLGHTPTPDEKARGVPTPDVVGFAGPFRLGLIGDEHPRWAILAKDWAIFKEDTAKVKRNSRRSVEIYQEEDPKDRYFDPIALLGAEMPQLNLGLAYSRVRPDRRIHRYTVAAPSATNVFVPSDKYQQTPDQPITTEHEELDMSDDDIQRIVAAIEQTDWAQYTIQKMEAEQAKGNVTDVPPPAEPVAEAPPVDAPPVDAPPVDAPPLDAPPPGDAAPLPDKDKEKMAMQYSRERAAEVARYQRVEKENADLKKRVEAIEAERVAIKRYSRIDTLASQFILDVEEEQHRADKMNDEQFADFYGDEGVIVKRYTKAPVDNNVFRMVEGPRPMIEPDKTAKIEKVKALANRYRQSGKEITFAEALAKVEAGEAA